jgi:4-hydroxybenzoate polyprenyltransferase
MPIAWGIHTSKVFTGVWIVVLFSAIIIIQLYVLQKGWWVSVLYCGAFILTPMMVFSKKLFIAKDKEQFAEISKWIKVVMLTGILSLVVIGYHLSQ